MSGVARESLVSIEWNFLQGFVHGDGLHALGYCVSVCDNKWNIHMQYIPRNGLEMFGHWMKSSNESIEELNLWECDIDQRGFENLAECIPYLHSLTSLNISGNSGGDGSLVKLLEALKEHGKLQTLDVHCIDHHYCTLCIVISIY